jgi:hypothetical protein
VTVEVVAVPPWYTALPDVASILPPEMFTAPAVVYNASPVVADILPPLM